MHSHTCSHSLSYMHTCTLTHAFLHMRTLSHIIHTLTQSLSHIHLCTQSHTHTYTHTNTHTENDNIVGCYDGITQAITERRMRGRRTAALNAGATLNDAQVLLSHTHSL
jgi:hypothetical protein